MSSPSPDLGLLVTRVVEAAIAAVRDGHAVPDGLHAAVVALREGYAPVPLTWGQVPAGWEVKAPDGRWYRVDSTRYANGKQLVGMLWRTFSRDPDGAVLARPGFPDATDTAIVALGFPAILEDSR